MGPCTASMVYPCERSLYGTATIIVIDPQTNATLSASPASGAAPLAVVFSNTTVGCEGGNFTFAYGDGRSDSVVVPADGCGGALLRNHTYIAPGTYTATLSYTNWTSEWFYPTPTIGTATITVY